MGVMEYGAKSFREEEVLRKVQDLNSRVQENNELLKQLLMKLEEGSNRMDTPKKE